MSDANKGTIAWFVNNPVAANLFACLILLAGLMSLLSMERELLPVPETKTILINALYATASPKEVDETITRKIEDAIKNISTIKRVQSTSNVGSAAVTIELYQDADVDLVLEEVKTAVDSVPTFPSEMKELLVHKPKPVELAVQLQLYGDLEETQAKFLAEEIKRELINQTIVNRVDILGTRAYEISINVSDEQLHKYKTTLRQIANRIQAESASLPIGGIKTSTENILVRVDGQSYRQQDFENIVLLTTETGTVVRVKDVAEVKDAFIDFDQKAHFDGKYSVGLTVSAVGDQDVIKVAEAAKKYVDAKQADLPEGVKLAYVLDISYYISARLNTMNSNLFWGGVLVFLLLALFMDFKIALWVIASIPTSMAGAFILMHLGIFNVTLNMISMFGFIMIVGIVMDDSIIVAESVDEEIKKSGFSKESVIRGTKKVATPAVFGILTTIAAFTPMLFAGGSKHVYLFSVGFVVCACLLFSLMESKWILPSHLMTVNTGMMRFVHSRHQHALQLWMNEKLSIWIQKKYLPFVTLAVAKRYVTLAIFFGILVMTLGAIQGGIIKYELFPPEPNDFTTVNFSAAAGLSKEKARLIQTKIEDGLLAMEKDYQKEFATEGKLVKHIFSYGSEFGAGVIAIELTKAETRQINTFQIAERWRKKVGEIDGATMTFSGAANPGTSSRDLSFLLFGADRKELEAAATELRDKLKKIEGLSGVSHSIEKGRKEFVLKLKPQASSLNLTLVDIASQVKDAFYGVEVQKILRDYEEISVYVRSPVDQRSSIMDLESLHIRVPDGRFLQLKELADIDVVWADTNIERINGENSVYVRAVVDEAVDNPGQISNQVIDEMMPKLLAKYSGVSYRPDGVSLDEKETEAEIKRYLLIVLLVVYMLLAIPLKSYSQPLIIMSAIPFGLVGAAWGHWLLGYPLSVMSLFGIIALCGIIVNDTLVLIDVVNTGVNDEGLDYKTASINGGALRFRSIMLTTVTTLLGDLPMILEKSLEAKNMVPMAISLGVGIVFAAAITLVLVPCLYVVLDDIKALFSKMTGKDLVDF